MHGVIGRNISRTDVFIRSLLPLLGKVLKNGCLETVIMDRELWTIESEENILRHAENNPQAIDIVCFPIPLAHQMSPHHLQRF
ncbi:hypothetical protein NPIL_313331 [Nephila pilipes]|uniref:Uncharacterized protein n=1 Tax=Nephila pilipes TaxID=299642 RepID=A0A8X6N708_NEPPI|nr:hypothetical protein NPIL_313331 [Nephila pilipes]